MTRSSALKEEEIKPNTSYIVPLDATLRQNIVWTDGLGKIHMLSEVAPDAIVTATVDLTSKLTAKLKSGDEITGEQLTKITESVNELGKRTMSVTILRDALYRLEEYNLNNDKTPMDTLTLKLFEKILDNAKEIALAEIKAEEAKKAAAEAKKAEEDRKKTEAEVVLLRLQQLTH